MVIHVIKAGVGRYGEVEVVPRGKRSDPAGFDGRDFFFTQAGDGLPDFLKLSSQGGERCGGVFKGVLGEDVARADASLKADENPELNH